jgi:hypothetical protein
MSRDLSSSLPDPVCGRWNDALRDLGMSDDEISAYFAQFSNISAAISAPRPAGRAATYPKDAARARVSHSPKPRGVHTMPQKEPDPLGTSEPLARDATPNTFEGFLNAQTAQSEKFQMASRYWLDRAREESKLALELYVKLAAAHSLSEAATAYQEWGSRHFELAAEDVSRIIANSQTLVEAGGRLLSGEWMGNARGNSGT